MTAVDKARLLRRSAHLARLANMGRIYLYHDLFGYILELSDDVLALLDAFEQPASPAEVCARFAGRFDGASPEQFVDIFEQFACLVVEGEVADGGVSREGDDRWDMVPVRARWTVWRRQGDTVAIFTAWGERPLARHQLDRTETAIWDDIDGESTAQALADRHGRGPVDALLRRLVHRDGQAVKLSPLPMRHYAGRPRLKPPYLDSTMPYAPYRPGDDNHSDTAANGHPDAAPTELSPREYYRSDVRDADAQFDHRETTLSHLFRCPHPALAGRSYGAALIDGLAARGWLPATGQGALRAVEIGAGLGYASRAIIDALASRGVDARYDIVELSPALADAQRERLGSRVTIHRGDALDVELPAASFDFIVCNEMIGDLPAVRLSHIEAGLEPGVTETERARRLDALGRPGRIIAEYELPLADAPDPFYVNTGAIELIRRMRGWLAPGGVVCFGKLATHRRTRPSRRAGF